MNFQKQPFDF